MTEQRARCSNCQAVIPTDADPCPHCGTWFDEAAKPARKRLIWLVPGIPLLSLAAILGLLFFDRYSAEPLPIPTQQPKATQPQWVAYEGPPVPPKTRAEEIRELANELASVDGVVLPIDMDLRPAYEAVIAEYGRMLDQISRRYNIEMSSAGYMLTIPRGTLEGQGIPVTYLSLMEQCLASCDGLSGCPPLEDVLGAILLLYERGVL